MTRNVTHHPVGTTQLSRSSTGVIEQVRANLLKESEGPIVAKPSNDKVRKPKVLNEVQLINCWIGIFVSHGEKDKENLPFNLAVDTSTLLTN